MVIREADKSSIENLLKLKNIRFLNSVSNWQEAVKVSLVPLIEQGYCEERYIDGVIENTNKFGPYYVLCENMALIHARAEQGVNDTQIAITLLKEPIKFKEDGYDVRILIALGAKDADTHIYVMQAISKIFSDEEKINKILDASTTSEIYNEFMNEGNV